VITLIYGTQIGRRNIVTDAQIPEREEAFIQHHVVTGISGGDDHWTQPKNGKQAEMSHWVVDKDGKTMSGTGMDANGKPYEFLYWCDRQ
jgi:hypothetical protein